MMMMKMMMTMPCLTPRGGELSHLSQLWMRPRLTGASWHKACSGRACVTFCRLLVIEVGWYRDIHIWMTLTTSAHRLLATQGFLEPCAPPLSVLHLSFQPVNSLNRAACHDLYLWDALLGTWWLLAVQPKLQVVSLTSVRWVGLGR